MNRLIQYRVQFMDALYRRTSISTYLLTIFLTIATLPIAVQTFEKNIPFLKDRKRQVFLTHSMLRAYSLALLWSPVELIVVLAIDQTHANYLRLMPVLLIISLVFLFADWLLQKNKYHHNLDIASFSKAISWPRKDFLKVAQLLFGIISLLVTVIIMNSMLKQGMLISIVITLIPYSLFWSLLLKKLGLVLSFVRKNWTTSLKRMPNFHALFLAAGFFITMVQQSALSDYLRKFLSYEADHWPTFVIFLMISLLFWLMSFCGFHAVVTIMIFAQILLPIFPGAENSLAILLIGTQMSLVMVSPFNIATAMMANLTQTNPLHIARWNLAFALCFMLAIDAAAYIIFI